MGLLREGGDRPRLLGRGYERRGDRRDDPATVGDRRDDPATVGDRRDGP